MSGSSRFSQLMSAEAGEIERRLQALEKRLNIPGARASISQSENVGSTLFVPSFRDGSKATTLNQNDNYSPKNLLRQKFFSRVGDSSV
jgi:hypothetical protein